jgi:hypothetical protein
MARAGILSWKILYSELQNSIGFTDIGHNRLKFFSRFFLLNDNTMKLKITWQYVIAFLALNMIMGELHEQVHINTGYLICGCYGSRDISSWATCTTCSNASQAFWATATGPLFSYAMMWLGALLFVRHVDLKKRAFGLALLFANLPFARIFTALMGGGDEKVFINHLMGEESSTLTVKMIASLVVVLVCWPPVMMVAKNLGNRNKWAIISGFLVLPLVFAMIYQRMFINGLLKNDVGEEVLLLGTPNLILIHAGLMIILLIIFRKSLTATVTNVKKP